jgi:hypothetical protein
VGWRFFIGFSAKTCNPKVLLINFLFTYKLLRSCVLLRSIARIKVGIERRTSSLQSSYKISRDIVRTLYLGKQNKLQNQILNKVNVNGSN